MTAFYGGQIKKEHSGDLSVVVRKNDNGRTYGAFVYPIESEEFRQLTGVMAAKYEPERVYIGLNSKAGDEIARRISGTPVGERALRSLDALIVHSFFLNNK